MGDGQVLLRVGEIACDLSVVGKDIVQKNGDQSAPPLGDADLDAGTDFIHFADEMVE
jgi:hypothetical protein